MKYKVEVVFGDFHVMDTETDKSVFMAFNPYNADKICKLMNNDVEFQERCLKHSGEIKAVNFRDETIELIKK